MKFMKGLFTIIWILLFCFSARAQKISLINFSANESQKYYNLDGAELFLVTGSDTSLMRKDDSLEFSMPTSFSLKDTTISNYILLLRVSKYTYIIKLEKEHLKYPFLRIGFFKEKRRSFQAVDLCKSECTSYVGKMNRVKNKKPLNKETNKVY